jgi:hypothetical protein
MAAHAGKSGAVYLAIESSTGVATLCLSLNAWTLDRNSDTFETTSFGATNKTFVQGLPNLTGTLSGVWNDAETKPFAGAVSSTGVKLYLYPDITNSPTKYAYGTAWLSAAIEAPVNGAVTLSANFSAAESWYVGL